MKTFVQEWLENNATTRDVVKDLKGMLNDKKWTSFFTHSEIDEPVTYTHSMNFMCKTVHLSKCGYASSIYSEDLALQLIKDALSENIKSIAKWLLNSDSTMQIFVFADDPIGSAVFKEDKSVDDEVPYAIMCLRKLDEMCCNTSGFMVEYIFPIPNI